MNRFELFCIIFYALDAEWDKSKNAELGEFLSGANPFLFKDIGSADPAVYEDFCKKMPKQITPEKSYEFAKEYILSLSNAEITGAFSSVSKKEWYNSQNRYLSAEHKGQSGRR